jgi:hypothetical protein
VNSIFWRTGGVILFLITVAVIFTCLNYPNPYSNQAPLLSAHLYFNGHSVEIRDECGQPLYIYPAKAGRPWRSPSDQAVKNQGPLPEGRYWVRTDRHISILDSRTLVDLSKWLGRSWGWGFEAVPLLPFPENRMYGRHSFFIHGGGWLVGSRGCIYLGFGNKGFHQQLVRIRKPVVLEVVYPKGDPKAKR